MNMKDKYLETLNSGLKEESSTWSSRPSTPSTSTGRPFTPVEGDLGLKVYLLRKKYLTLNY